MSCDAHTDAPGWFVSRYHPCLGARAHLAEVEELDALGHAGRGKHVEVHVELDGGHDGGRRGGVQRVRLLDLAGDANAVEFGEAAEELGELV